VKQIWLFALLAGLAMGACSSINIQTGPPTDEEFTARSDTQARQFKTEWYTKLDQANSTGKLGLMNELINQTVAGYIKYGRSVAGTWQQANRERGTAVHASEILKMVEQSTATDQPMIQAHTDVVEFGISEIINTGNFEQPLNDTLNSYREFFNEVYNGVFLPNGAVEDYIETLDRLEQRQAAFYEQLVEETRR